MAKKVHIKTLLRSNDAFLTTSERVYNYYLSNTRKIWIVAGIAVAVVISVLVLRHVHDARLASGVAAFNRAVEAPDPGLALSGLEDVAKRYSGTPAARQARFAMVSSHLAEGRVDEAIPILEDLSKTLTTAEESLKPLIRSTLAGLYEDKGRFEEALALYRECLSLARAVPSTQASVAFQTELLNSIARVAQAVGRPAEAVEAYEALLALAPNSYRSFGAQVRLSKLAAASPAAEPAAGAPADGTAGEAAPDSPAGEAAPAGDSPDSPAADEATAGEAAPAGDSPDSPAADEAAASDAVPADGDAPGAAEAPAAD
jgi:tetratricopeptide (TPR) repeat protein